MFSTNECLVNPSDLLRLWLHETHRVYGDKLTEEKDIDAFLKMQVDICKKNFEVLFLLFFDDFFNLRSMSIKQSLVNSFLFWYKRVIIIISPHLSTAGQTGHRPFATCAIKPVLCLKHSLTLYYSI